MRRFALLLTAALLSTSAWANHCPADMAKIDAELASSPPSDPTVLAEVKKLRAEGEELHKAGDHAKSMETLAKAQALLDANE
ncbi:MULTISPECIES: hypothetical protein [Pseudomonas]|uniref:hypothetical protein n=1 Tax=Pseudomonas TaxID=286 RepID=UPI001561C415|nr:hypothetical protein [Pseudomonas sp. MS19]NRH28343.1 hypothetical protein [Pseudomonas sp. MS19]